jgi:hypothetical protein
MSRGEIRRHGWRSEVGGLCQRRLSCCLWVLQTIWLISRKRRQVALLKLPAGHRLIHFDALIHQCGSPPLGEAGERGPLWIWSDEQTGGRGRHRRTWSFRARKSLCHLPVSNRGSWQQLAQVSFCGNSPCMNWLTSFAEGIFPEMAQ